MLTCRKYQNHHLYCTFQLVSNDPGSLSFYVLVSWSLTFHCHHLLSRKSPVVTSVAQHTVISPFTYLAMSPACVPYSVLCGVPCLYPMQCPMLVSHSVFHGVSHAMSYVYVPCSVSCNVPFFCVLLRCLLNFVIKVLVSLLLAVDSFGSPSKLLGFVSLAALSFKYVII